MEPPLAEQHQQLVAENVHYEDSNSVETLLRQATATIAKNSYEENNEPKAQQPQPENHQQVAAEAATSNVYSFLDELDQLGSSNVKEDGCGAVATACNRNTVYDKGDEASVCDMGSYASRSSAGDEELRLEANSENGGKPAEVTALETNGTPTVPGTETTSDHSQAASTSSARRRPTSDFQPLGSEVSAEVAQQLKKDVRRLSPVHVSQRERTLGEISLFSSPLLDALGETEPESAPVDKCASVAVVAEDIEKSSATDTVLRERVSSVADDCSGNFNNDINNSDGFSSGGVGGAIAGSVTGDGDNTSGDASSSSRRELVIRLSRVDGKSPSSVASPTPATASSEEFELLTGVMAENSDPSALAAVPLDSPPACPFGTNLVLERCNAPGYSEERSLSRAFDSEPSTPRPGAILSPDPTTIVTKLSIGNEIEFSSSVAGTSSAGRSVHCGTSSPSIPLPVFNVEAEENDLDGGSDSSDVLSTIVAAEGVVVAALAEDGLSQAIISRLEQDRPVPFTEDSAESLTLVSRDEVRSDGSDSGLGNEMAAAAPESDSETSFLDRIPDDILLDKDKNFASDVPKAPTLPEKAPSKSSLKRRLTTDCLEDNDEPSLKRPNLDESGNVKNKRNIQFDAVTVYYFPRTQGFTCVPSQGGSTLGMTATHSHAERFSLTEHAVEQRRLHRARLAQLRQERAATLIANSTEFGASSSEDPSDDTDEEPCDSSEELDIDSYYFLQPVPAWQRRALLRSAGVRRIDTNEKEECKDIRASREHCGCACKGYCDPESCPCSRANVKCQVDRTGFPCGCSRDGCANSSGRIEFNPVRVRTHFIHTLMRLELEKKPHHRDEEHQQHQQESQHHQNSQQQNGRLGAPMPDPSADCLGSGFTGLHYDSQDGTTRPESLDLYTIRDDCYPSDDCLGESSQQQRKLHNEFAQSFQHYGPQNSGLTFQQNPYADYQGYQSLPSTSRSPFQSQFQNPSFSHYGSYVQDAGASSNSTCHQTAHSLIQQHSMYDAPFAQDEMTGSQYTNLTNSLQSSINSMNKLEPFAEMLSAARYSYYGDMVEHQQQQQQQQQVNHHHHHQQEHQHHLHHHPHHHQSIYGQTNGTAKTDVDKDVLSGATGQSEQLNDDDDNCDENFGEIIKKSMVETVSA
ncbi:uncharacterized protein LOC106636361 [Copidosoma floridanum]|uniref:uncharacterized protein LOC106636361 n=1 Tax=Copidosoma floridanum TaxID=29053 RepID=UPI0006C99AFA|nr:uncharacterized protein LOC106636361 [Copidosoma floridanum]